MASQKNTIDDDPTIMDVEAPTPPSPSPVTLTVGDIIGTNSEALAENDVIRTLEQQKQAGKNKSTRQVRFPDIPDKSLVEFEEAMDDEEVIVAPLTAAKSTSPGRGGGLNMSRSNGLRDLTAQLILTTEENDHNDRERIGMNAATRGTAADRMADKAVAMFTSMGSLPTSLSPTMAGGGGPNPTSSDSDQEDAAVRRLRFRFRRTKEKLRMNRELFLDYFRPRKKVIGHYWWIRLKYIIVPGVTAAVILFYAAGNPYPRATKLDKNGITASASISWWILFAVRLTVTLSSAKMWEMFLIDFLAMKTGILRGIVGPYVSLWIVQSQGWPFQALIWGITNQIFLTESTELGNHWLYFQNEVDVFNEKNPSGTVLQSELYRNLLVCIMVFGAVTAVKRVLLSNVIGKRLVVNYGTQLEALMQKVILLTEIAGVGKRLSGGSRRVSVSTPMEFSDPDAMSPVESFEQDKPATFGSFQFGSSGRTGTVIALLGDWVEPEYIGQDPGTSKVTIASLLHFRRALAFIDAEYPFSFAFGLAKTRVDCVESAQRLFSVIATDEETMSFDVLAPLVFDQDHELDRIKLKNLCRLLRPAKDGTVSRLEFLRSIDNVYKELRTLVASIENSSQIEQNYESLVNVVHYFGLFAVGCIFHGVDFQSMLVSISALFLGIGFIIGGACANFLEGLLMVFVRRPFDVGDRVSIQDVTGVSDAAGAAGWIVEKVDLYATTLRYGATRELATVTNGELARKRIINMQRSKRAIVFIDMKFSIDVTHSQMDVLKKEIQDYAASRPQEWVTLASFRVTEVHQDSGFVLYRITLQHQESWQNVAIIAASKGDVARYILDKCRELNLRYTSPSYHVEMSLREPIPPPPPGDLVVDTAAQAAEGGQDLVRAQETPHSVQSLRAMFVETKKSQ